MTLFQAFAWTFAARFAIDLFASLFWGMRPNAPLDAVTVTLCQGIVLLGALYLLLERHEAGRTPGEALAMRPTAWTLCLLGIGLGVSLQIPFDAFSQLIDTRWPISDQELVAQAEAYAAPTIGRKLALVAAAGLVGPVSEELFFRGGLFGRLSSHHPREVTVVSVALFFAAAHLSLRYAVPLFVLALVLTYGRALCGSVWPGLCMHVTFNTAELVETFRHPETLTGRATHFTGRNVIAALVMSAALMVLFVLIARRHPRCVEARVDHIG